MWLKNPDTPTQRSWSNAVAYCEGLDGSNGRGGYTDWRLANVKEMASLIDSGQYNPALPVGHPFSFDALRTFWVSTVEAGSAIHAWYVVPYSGEVYTDLRSAQYCAWPVRAGH